MNWTVEAVLDLAPDEASVKAARGLMAPTKWPTLGADEAAVWGECQGSGSKPYQTQLDVQGLAFRCSCPSRKFPCKHGLALMLLYAAHPERFAVGPAPSWVGEWLQSRARKAQQKEEKAQAATAVPADPDAVARRARQRWERMASAGVELQRWLGDQVARGLGRLGREQRTQWATMAARLVDMQLPGLAQRLTEAAELIGQGPDWPERMLHALGLLQLACEALQRHETLSAPLRAELRAVLGWPLDKAEVLAEGEVVRDHWLVTGQATEERSHRLTERRVWLLGQATRRRALLLDHAFAGKGFESGWHTGHSVESSVVFFPGSSGLRALVAGTSGTPQAALPQPASLDDEWLQLSHRVAASPWATLHPMLFGDAVFVRADERWRVQAQGHALPVAMPEEEAWLLLAHGGGRPLQLMGEWNGRTLQPLAAWTDEGLWQPGAAA